MSVGGGSVCSGGEGTSFVSTGSRKGQECEWCLISFSKFLPEKNQSVVLSMLSPRNKQRLGTAPQHVLQLQVVQLQLYLPPCALPSPIDHPAGRRTGRSCSWLHPFGRSCAAGGD